MDSAYNFEFYGSTSHLSIASNSKFQIEIISKKLEILVSRRIYNYASLHKQDLLYSRKHLVCVRLWFR